jgi:phage/plasmid-associated DNA primase
MRMIFGRNDFYSSGQIPLDLVSVGMLDRFGYVDPTDGGRVRLGKLSVYYSKWFANGDTLRIDKAPKVRDDDAAMWRRILRIPFENVIPKERRDPTVKKQLKDPNDAGPGILAWAVKGCLRWQEERLQVPPLVEQATEASRLDMDPLRQFFEDCCVFGNSLKVTAARLHQEYETWCRENGEREATGKEFSQRFRERNCQPGKVNRQRGWHGIGVPGTEWDTGTPRDGSFG